MRAAPHARVYRHAIWLFVVLVIGAVVMAVAYVATKEDEVPLFRIALLHRYMQACVCAGSLGIAVSVAPVCL